jgi:hypothetical protein
MLTTVRLTSALRAQRVSEQIPRGEQPSQYGIGLSSAVTFQPSEERLDQEEQELLQTTANGISL